MTRLARRELPAAVADRWIGLLRPSLHLRAAGNDEPVVGQLGGVPALPDRLPWPHWDDQGPLTFIAEIDCGQLPSDTLSLPRTGTLSFFYWDGQAGGQATFGGSPENLAAARVIYTPAGAAVTERDPPAGIDPYDLVELAGELVTTGPAWDSPVFRAAVADLREHRAFLDDWSNGDTFARELWELAPGDPDHRLGGHARPVQGPVELDVAQTQLGGQVPYADPALHQEAAGWTLLAQFDSDRGTGMMWGDRGILYWLIRPGDLAARRLEAASFTWQCT